MNIKQLKEQIDLLFNERLSYMMLLQEISEHFYPERADFTIRRNLGTEYASDLMTSYPILVRRELGDQIGQMLRPTGLMWHNMKLRFEEKPDNDGRRWMEWANKRMHNAMYSQPALFERAAKETDHDFATYGNPIMSCRINRNADNLLYKNWHIRDVVWMENEEGGLGLVARKWKPGARELIRLFKGREHEKVRRKAEKHPFERIKCYHIEVEADLYDDDARGRPLWSIYYDAENKHIMEAVPVWDREYIIPRWQTVSGSQYAFSPATITALPEARMIQAMAFTILEAGEKATNPPMVATQDAVRSDVSIYAGGITYVDKEYDERLGAALRPISQDKSGLPFGQEMILDSRDTIAQAFYLNKLAMPERGPEMTAYEVGQRVQEYIRGALPLFAPMEPEYNGQVCMSTFKRLLRVGHFGSPHDIPASVNRVGIEFDYISPLHSMIDEQKGQKFLESKALLAEAIDVDPGSAYVFDARAGLREALEGIGVPATWTRSEDDVEEMVEQEAEAIEQQQQLEAMVQSSEVVKNLGQGSEQLEAL
jgi:hypothetical protein